MTPRKSDNEPERSGGLTRAEMAVVDRLSEAMSLFADLPEMHPSDRGEFAHHVHILQRAVMCRSARRAHPEVFGKRGGKWDEELMRDIARSEGEPVDVMEYFCECQERENCDCRARIEGIAASMGYETRWEGGRWHPSARFVH